MLNRSSLKGITLLVAGLATLLLYPPLTVIFIFAIPNIRTLMSDAVKSEAWTWRDLFWTLLFSGVWVMSALSALILMMDANQPKPQAMVTLDKIFTAVLLAPFFEEFLFRYVILNQLKRRIGIVLAVLATSLLFGFLHGGFSYTTPIIALGGILLSLIYLGTRSIAYSSLFHSAHNASLCALAMIEVSRPEILRSLSAYKGLLVGISLGGGIAIMGFGLRLFRIIRSHRA